MSYRPYPNADRALAQVRRNKTATEGLRLVKQVAEMERRMRLAAVAHAFPLGEYRLSTRPRIVGGGS